MELDDRKKRILQSIIEQYIGTAEPVSSGALVDNYGMELSSATIRNEMANLEQNGYIEKPHTSAGRIPSAKGYRFYVDELLKDDNISFDEIKYIQKCLQTNANAMEELTKIATHTLSEITHYTTVAIGPKTETHTIIDIKFVLLGTRLLMAVILTDTGIVKETMIKFDSDITELQVEKLNYVFNSKLRGKALGQIDIPMKELIMSEMAYELKIIKPIIEEINKVVKEDYDIYLEGRDKVFDFPEFSDLDTARKLLNMLETKDLVCEILDPTSNNNINVYIGNENEYDELKNLSIIVFRNAVNEKDLGTIGIIGPTRMDYSKVISVMKYINAVLNEKWKTFEDNHNIEKEGM